MTDEPVILFLGNPPAEPPSAAEYREGLYVAFLEECRKYGRDAAVNRLIARIQPQ